MPRAGGELLVPTLRSGQAVKRRGLAIAPEIAVGDGALGFWKALDEVLPTTRHQRCWLHKAANLLNKVLKSVQGAMKADIREISMAPTRVAAEAAIAVFKGHSGANSIHSQTLSSTLANFDVEQPGAVQSVRYAR